MTSSHSAAGKTSGSRRTALTRHSSETSPLSLISTDPSKIRSQIDHRELQVLRSVISSLGLIEGPRGASYAEIRDFEERTSTSYFGHFDHRVWYVPNDIPLPRIVEAAEELKPVPADTGEMRVALYQLWLTTKHEKLNQDDREAMLTVYTKRLSEYPADFVAYVLSDLSDNCKFFPSWAEIKEPLTGLMGWRSVMLSALRRLHKKKMKGGLEA